MQPWTRNSYVLEYSGNEAFVGFDLVPGWHVSFYTKIAKSNETVLGRVIPFAFVLFVFTSDCLKTSC